MRNFEVQCSIVLISFLFFLAKLISSPLFLSFLGRTRRSFLLPPHPSPPLKVSRKEEGEKKPPLLLAGLNIKKKKIFSFRGIATFRDRKMTLFFYDLA